MNCMKAILFTGQGDLYTIVEFSLSLVQALMINNAFFILFFHYVNHCKFCKNSFEAFCLNCKKEFQ